MSSLFLRNTRVLDVRTGELRELSNIWVENGRIRDIDASDPKTDIPVLDLGGRTVMPGLIDAHVHVMISELDALKMKGIPPTLATARSGPILSGMLDRGFTTVRDTAGADHGLREAVASGLVRGPRLFICGRAISQTGGHVDFRDRTEHRRMSCVCCNGLDLSARVADGVPGILEAVREELRQGADHIKIAVSGGVASPIAPFDSLQYTVEEIRAAVQAATDWGTYVCAHAYSAASIRRALECGVRSIEHGNMIDEASAQLGAQQGAFLVPTLATYEAMALYGAEYGLDAVSLERNRHVLSAGLTSLEIARGAGMRIAFGSDLLGQLHHLQSREFMIRSDVMSPLEIIQSATLTNAELLRREGELGIIEPGALADLIAVDGDPLANIALLGEGSKHIPVVIKDGQVTKDARSASDWNRHSTRS
ncbi:amidohydrolase family protein [Paraburkholderia sp. EG287B]|uniref:metal-dependent hydrolase family protein n=1 Tax=unclassified Paraburkholderia TaxID=2615204 RepID=UPI0034D1B006